MIRNAHAPGCNPPLEPSAIALPPDEQLRIYGTQGYFLATGLIAPEITGEAAATMRRLQESGNTDSCEGSTSPHHVHQIYDEPSLLECYTPEMRAFAARLAGYDAARFRPPRRAYAITTFPCGGRWSWPQPHIDHAHQEYGHRVFPPPFRIAAIIYLSDVPPHGGGTMVWPGSHRNLEKLAKSRPTHYQMMSTLNLELDKVELGHPRELTPQCGDVLFYHYLCAHSGTINTSNRARLALNVKW